MAKLALATTSEGEQPPIGAYGRRVKFTTAHAAHSYHLARQPTKRHRRWHVLVGGVGVAQPSPATAAGPQTPVGGCDGGVLLA
eukprot:SAG11_NODE_24027_length_379_cov_0.742857_1_plen_82_part_10